MFRILLATLLCSTTFACGNNAPNNAPTDMGDPGGDAAQPDMNQTAGDVDLDDTGVDMDEPEATAAVELIYDDDISDFGFLPLGEDGYSADAVLAQFFEPPADGVLRSVQIMTAPSAAPTGPLEVQVYAAQDGEPAEELLAEPMLVAATEAPLNMVSFATSAIDIDLSELDLSVATGGFFIGVRFVATTDAESPTVAMDVHSTEEYDRAWFFEPGGDWVRLIDIINPDARSVPMIRATVEVPETAVPATQTLLSNAPRDCRNYLGGILPDGLTNQWSVARLVPPATPFEVTSIRYELRDGDNANFPPCDATLEHRAWVFKGGASPPETPDPLAEFTVQLGEDEVVSEMTPVTFELEPPVTLSDGEFLYVAVEMPGDAPRLCVGVCGDSFELEENWLSGGLMPPFAWTNFDVLGAELSVTHRAYGR